MAKLVVLAQNSPLSELSKEIDKCKSEQGTVPAVWYVLELFRQCGMLWKCSDSVVCFGTVPTVWYVLELFRQCGMFWNCSDSVVWIKWKA
jgi:hypothetical protein